MVGRKREAEVQWRRALSLGESAAPDGEAPDPARLRAKLERGLDAVLAEEAARETAGDAPAPAPAATANGG